MAKLRDRSGSDRALRLETENSRDGASRRKSLRYLRKNENAESSHSRRRSLTRWAAVIPQTEKAPPRVLEPIVVSSRILAAHTDGGAVSGAADIGPTVADVLSLYWALSAENRIDFLTEALGSRGDGAGDRGGI